MSHEIKSKLSKMKASAKRMLLLRIYMYAIASGNKHLLSMFKVGKSKKKGRKRRGHKRHHKGKKHRRGHKLHGAAKAAFLRRMAAGRRKAKR